jgi:hypothetical protein
MGFPERLRVGPPSEGSGRRSAGWPAALPIGRLAGILLPALALSGPALASAITVQSATYGGSCGIVADNAGSQVKAACNGSQTCSYRVDYQRLGDPAPGCPKTFVALYSCAGSPSIRTAWVPSEAGSGRMAVLDCQGVNPPSTTARLAPVPPMPSTIEESELGVPGVWYLPGKQGMAYFENGAIAQLTVEEWDRDGVVISRQDVDGPSAGLSAIYRGTIASDGIANPSVLWTWAGHGQTLGTFTASFHTVTLAEAKAGAKAEEVPANVQNKDADKFKDLRWYLAGAALGDPDMEADAGFFLAAGAGYPHDFATAFRLFSAAAAQGETTGEVDLGYMFAQGWPGHPPDMAKAKAWFAKAGPVGAKAAEQVAESQKQEAAKAQLNSQSAAAVLGVLGAMLGSGDSDGGAPQSDNEGYSVGAALQQQQYLANHDYGWNGQ